ncbi:hypothetical protein G3M48_001982 [Beauveria asiatica]|uniref:Uncharacterized protein n=1 Tax=Beauveria asiatica TaxID=1069075 RepID=A0AAW0RY94_9HYPO
MTGAASTSTTTAATEFRGKRFEGRIQRGVDQYMINGQEAQSLDSWLEISWDEYNV